MSGEPIRVLLADADPLQREGWRQVIDAQPDLQVVAEAVDGVEALAVLRRVHVGAAILDARMPELGGLEVLEQVASDARIRLTQRSQPTRIVLVTATDLDRFAAAGLQAGAAAVLDKGAQPEALLAVLRRPSS